jgi:hypothetical protein
MTATKSTNFVLVNIVFEALGVFEPFLEGRSPNPAFHSRACHNEVQAVDAVRAMLGE